MNYPSVPADYIEERAQELFATLRALELTLGTAAFCTGGLLASLFTDIDGCSHAFERGIVAYTEDAKEELLGVPASLLEEYGAVSKPVALAMVEGLLKRSNADIAVSTTGFAGAAGPGNEEGLVHFGCARRGCASLHREEHFGPRGRQGIRQACVRTVLEMVTEILE
jgi:nicotinamide-nucleotide amidase